jgi:hypothetical protein
MATLRCPALVAARARAGIPRLCAALPRGAAAAAAPRCYRSARLCVRAASDDDSKRGGDAKPPFLRGMLKVRLSKEEAQSLSKARRARALTMLVCARTRHQILILCAAPRRARSPCATWAWTAPAKCVLSC